MPAVILAAEGVCLRCCRQCGGLLPRQLLAGRKLPPSSRRSLFSTTSSRQDDREQQPRHARRRDNKVYRRYDRKGDTLEPLASKISMSKQFNLANDSSPPSPILLRNYELRKHGSKPTVPARLPKADHAEVADLAESLQVEEEPGADYNEEEVDRDIDAVRAGITGHDRTRRAADARRHVYDESKSPPRHNMPQAEPAGNIILYHTYERTLKSLTSTYTQDQLSSYMQNFLGKADRSQYKGASDVSSIILSGQGLHQGWRVKQPPRPERVNEEDQVQTIEPWLRLPYAATRSLRSVADRIIRLLWRFEVEEEINSRGVLIHSVDNVKAPFLAGSRRVAFLKLIGNLPNVHIEISSSGDRITLTGSKYDCLDAERIIKSRIEEIAVIELDIRELLPNLNMHEFLSQDVVLALAEACGCVIPNPEDHRMKILGVNILAVQECNRAIISVVKFPSQTSYAIMAGGDGDAGFLHANQQATEALSWLARRKSLGRFATLREVNNNQEAGDRPQLHSEKLVQDMEDFEQHLEDPAAFLSSISDRVRSEHIDEAGLVWRPETQLTAEIGSILHELKDGEAFRAEQPNSLTESVSETLAFAPALPGLLQILRTSFRQPTPSISRYLRVRLMARPQLPPGKLAPWLEIDCQNDANGIAFAAARVVVKTAITDVMLPNLATDVRFTNKHILELANAAQNTDLASFAEKVRFDGIGSWSAPYYLKVKFPYSALMEETTTAKTTKTKRKWTKNGLVDGKYFPVTVESIQKMTFPFRKNLLEVTSVSGGRFGETAEKISFRMLDSSKDRDFAAGIESLGLDGAEPDEIVEEQATDVVSEETSSSPSFAPPTVNLKPAEASATPHDTKAKEKETQTTLYLRAVAHLVRRLNTHVGDQHGMIEDTYKPRVSHDTSRVRKRPRDDSTGRRGRYQRARARTLEGNEDLVPFRR